MSLFNSEDLQFIQSMELVRDKNMDGTHSVTILIHYEGDYAEPQTEICTLHSTNEIAIDISS